MMSLETTALQGHKYNINVIVDGSDISLEVNVEEGVTPYWIEIQRALLLMSLQIGSKLDEE
jgi:hypothetical protein